MEPETSMVEHLVVSFIKFINYMRADYLSAAPSYLYCYIVI